MFGKLAALAMTVVGSSTLGGFIGKKLVASPTTVGKVLWGVTILPTMYIAGKAGAACGEAIGEEIAEWVEEAQ